MDSDPSLSSWVNTRFLPPRFAAYRASSAARIRSSAAAATSSGRQAMPKLALTRRPCGNSWLASTWRIRSA